MARRLAGSVPVHNDDGTVTWYGPGDKVPPAVAKELDDHVWADGDDNPEEVIPTGVVSAGEAPPKSGKGSGEGAWRDYAAANGISIPDDAKKVDIIAAVEAAGVAAE